MRSTAGANGLAQGKRLTKQRVASKLQPVLAGVTVESKPLRHSAPADGLEPFAHPGRFEFVDACLRQLDHEVAGRRDHGEDLVVDLQRRQAECLVGSPVGNVRLLTERLDDGEPFLIHFFGVHKPVEQLALDASSLSSLPWSLCAASRRDWAGKFGVR